MFIFRRKGGLTAKKLARLIGCKCSYKYIPQNRMFIINYGGKYTEANLNANVVFNKFEAFRKLRDGGLPQPRMFWKSESIPEDAFPLLARKKYHSKGRDIVYIHNRSELNRLETWKYDFLSEYVDKKSEYRVHILGNYATIVNVKFNPDGRGDPIVRSKQNGWKQISYEGEHKQVLIELAKKAIRVLGYNFGIIDIIRKKDKFYILEVNSNAGLEERKLQIYANYFKNEERKWMNSNYRRTI